jgi:uncharacterized protein DUF4062/SIR2-like protein
VDVPRRLRVFISSTMEDLANERDALREKLLAFNFEPVNAEAMVPSGKPSWTQLRDEIESCDLFLLLLGERYGWIPDDGPKSEEGKAVTELEFDEARRVGLPVFPFVKRLRDGSNVSDQEANDRDAFRARVGAWKGGYFRAEFELARDLAEKAGEALTGFLGNEYLQKRVADRRGSVEPETAARDPDEPIKLDDELVAAVADRSAVLLVGAGVSLQAGLPSAAAFIAAMEEGIREVDPRYQPTSSGSRFFAVATDFESLLGGDRLTRAVSRLVAPAFIEGPTRAHRTAVALFDLVVTTNYDELLEQAAASDGGAFAVLAGEEDNVSLEGRTIVKLHGTISRPDTLVLTEAQLAASDAAQSAVRQELQDQLRRRPLVTVGSSLRDPSLIRFLESCGSELRGWTVADRFDVAGETRLARWNMKPIRADSESFFAALRGAIDSDSSHA